MLIMERLQREAALQECVVLSTCNRFEVYGIADNVITASEDVVAYVERDNNLPVDALSSYLYRRTGADASAHLMRVAAGLDSMVLGEAQILGQVSDAYQLAQQINTSSAVLHRLFELASHAGKRTHNETAIGEHTTSISHAAVVLALSIMGDFTDKKALVVGAGKMASLAIDALRSHGVETVDVVNRTEENARELASITGGRAYGWHELHTALVNSDVIFTATGAPHTVIHEPDVELAMQKRNGHEMVLIDTAVPRDVGDGVETVPGVHFYNIDDLQKVVDANYAKRRACVPSVEEIIYEENDKFVSWLRSREVVPAIRGLRQKIQSIAESELEAVLPQLAEEEQEIVSKLVHRIVNKVLHEPTVRLREQAAHETSEDYVYALRNLFDLDAEEFYG